MTEITVELITKNTKKPFLVSLESLEKVENFSSFWYENNRGYIQVTKKGKTVMLHRLITDCPYNFVVDHINSDKKDNTLKNLKLCKHGENIARGKKRFSKHGIKQKGVFKSGNNFIVRIKFNNKFIYKGTFYSLEKAEKAASELHNKLLN